MRSPRATWFGRCSSCPRARTPTICSKSCEHSARTSPSFSTSTAASRAWSRWKTCSKSWSAPSTTSTICPLRPILIRKLGDSRYEVDATLTLDVLNDRLGLQLPTDGEFQTIGGLVFHRAGAAAQQGRSSPGLWGRIHGRRCFGSHDPAAHDRSGALEGRPSRASPPIPGLRPHLSKRGYRAEAPAAKPSSRCATGSPSRRR